MTRDRRAAATTEPAPPTPGAAAPVVQFFSEFDNAWLLATTGCTNSGGERGSRTRNAHKRARDALH
ncbi:MAG: hypothetical protein Tsb0020_48940 [Haliangiales bacterium]